MSRHICTGKTPYTCTSGGRLGGPGHWVPGWSPQLWFLLCAAKKGTTTGSRAADGAPHLLMGTSARPRSRKRKKQLSAKTSGVTFPIKSQLHCSSFHLLLIVNQFSSTCPSFFSNSANAANAAAKTKQVLANTIKVQLQVSIKPLKTHSFRSYNYLDFFFCREKASAA